jgi:hypothetical protein
MNTQIVAVLFQEGGKLLSEFIRSRPPKHATATEPLLPMEQLEIRALAEDAPSEGKKDIATGCVPCAIGHVGTCSGLLAEALRFGKQEGIGSPEVSERVNLCLDELNAMERVDLRPEKIVELSQWEKGLANKALTESRAMRHELEGLTSVDDLEKVAARTQSMRQEIGRDWFQQRLSKMPKEEKAKLAEKALERLQEGK